MGFPVIFTVVLKLTPHKCNQCGWSSWLLKRILTDHTLHISVSSYTCLSDLPRPILKYVDRHLPIFLVFISSNTLIAFDTSCLSITVLRISFETSLFSSYLGVGAKAYIKNHKKLNTTRITVIKQFNIAGHLS